MRTQLPSTVEVAVAVGLFASAGCGTASPSSGFAGHSGSSTTAAGASSIAPGSPVPVDAGAVPMLDASMGTVQLLGSSGSSANGASGAQDGSASSSGTAGACPAGLQCNVACSGGATTTISGTVYDPAAKNPLYNVAVYVPAAPLQALPSGVPTGSAACSCSALFPSGALVSTSTTVDGTFKLANVPVGPGVPLVVQIGKWRRVFHVDVAACMDNPSVDKSLTLPGSVTQPDDSMPDIAVSTGASDSLECLMTRIGLPATEYVAGASAGGHVHIFSGGSPAARAARGALVGGPENPPMAGAPASSTSLWASQDQLMRYDIVLLSCEGGETFDANPPALEAYLNAGGRAFASHYHHAWFSGPIGSAQAYAAPADWGTNLATWTPNGGAGNGPIAGVIDTTLNGSAQPFPKGVALQHWLGLVGALGTDGVPAGDLAIYQPRDNAQVAASNMPSQPWITSDPWTAYFSFDAPVNAAPAVPGGPPNYCGRAVFSDLHVAGNPATMDTAPPPTGCSATDLSPQEKALEFMLFDLSSCVIPDTATPSPSIPPIVR
jgi:hypothetical protein